MVTKSKLKPAPASKPTEENPVRRIAFDLESPLAEINNGIQTLMLMKDGMGGADETAAVYFVASGLEASHQRVHAMWRELFDFWTGKKAESDPHPAWFYEMTALWNSDNGGDGKRIESKVWELLVKILTTPAKTAAGHATQALVCFNAIADDDSPGFDGTAPKAVGLRRIAAKTLRAGFEAAAGASS